ncbi:MAG: transporter [Opitutaceae bacterium]|nr:transporter [Opitutaceae bacterium]
MRPSFTRLPRLFLALLPALAAGVSGAAPAAPALRELTTDRPDATESPFTIDAGRVQLELEAASYTRDRSEGVRTTEWALAPFNLRYGLTRQTELAVIVSPHQRVSTRAPGGPRTTVRGFGATTLRTKVNFQGNDGGGTAFGLIADLKLPTAAAGLDNDKVEGALTFPAAYEVGAGWSGGAMTSVEFVHTDTGRRAVWVNTVTFARELAENLGVFLELTSAAGDGTHAATFNGGFTRRLGPRLQLDAGVNVGLSRAAADLTVFAGLARKF